MFDEDLRALSQHFRRRTNSDYRPAVLGRGDGVIADPDHPGYVFVREQTSNGLSAGRSVLLPSNVPIILTSGTKVKLGFDEQDREIILGGDTSGTLAAGLNTVSELQRAQSGRNNQVSIETLAVIPTSPPSLSVFIKAWSIIVAGIYSEFLGINTGDLTLPSSGQMYYASLFITNDYATIEIEYSTARSTADIPLGSDDVQECINAATATSTPVWAIPLDGDMTAIGLSDIQRGRDLRQMVNNAESGGGTPQYDKRGSWFSYEFIGPTLTEDATTSATQRFGFAQYQTAAAINDAFTVSKTLKAATYTLHILGITETDAGISEVFVGPNTGSLVSQGTLDWYSNPQVKNVIKTISITVLNDGYQIIQLKMTSKNGSSSNYFFIWTNAWITPSAD